MLNPFWWSSLRKFILASLCLSLAYLPTCWAAEPEITPFEKKMQANQGKSDRDGDAAAKSGSASIACAIYLNNASKAFAGENFERARPCFDKAFLQAEKMPEAEQKEVLKEISEFLHRGHSSSLDYDVYKYFAQRRLHLLRSQKSASVTQIYNEVQTLAYSCSRNHRYNEALALLKETLADLERGEKNDYAISSCLETLARVSEDSGDIEGACSYYEKEIAFTKLAPGKRNYDRTLEHYTTFLIRHKRQKGLVETARAFYNEIQTSGDKDRMPLGTVAQGLVDVDFDLANKFYRMVFDQLKKSAGSAMNSGYGNWACRWATVLHDKGKSKEAIEVLKEGIAFCRTTRWEDAMQRDGKEMIELCQKYLNETNGGAEARQMQYQLDNDLANRNRLHQEELERKLNGPAVEPTEKIRAAMEMANNAFNKDNCTEAIRLVEIAVAVYEANADSPSSAEMYQSIYNVRRRFAKCGREVECKPLLLRIVKARMIRGFVDPAQATYWSSNCGGTSWAFDDLVGRSFMSSPGGLDEMLALAKASGKSGNIAFVLEYKKGACIGEDRLLVEQELEKLRAGYADKSAYVSSLINTASTMAYLKKWDEAKSKCLQAMAAAKANNGGKARLGFRLAGSLYNMGTTFRSAGRLADASELSLEAYRLSVKEDRDVIIKMDLRCFDDLLKAYDKEHDTVASARLLTELLNITKSALGQDNTFTRGWLMRLSTHYLQSGDVTKGKQYYKELETSLFKPGMSVSKDNEVQLPTYANTLKQYGCSSEATKISSKLKELESAHCGAH